MYLNIISMQPSLFKVRAVNCIFAIHFNFVFQSRNCFVHLKNYEGTAFVRFQKSCHVYIYIFFNLNIHWQDFFEWDMGWRLEIYIEP